MSTDQRTKSMRATALKHQCPKCSSATGVDCTNRTGGSRKPHPERLSRARWSRQDRSNTTFGEDPVNTRLRERRHRLRAEPGHTPLHDARHAPTVSPVSGVS